MSNVSLINGHIDEYQTKMTYDEALDLLNDMEFADKYQDRMEYSDMLLLCKNALEKQIPKKGNIKYVSSYTDDPPVMVCPCCQNIHPCEASALYKYCFFCGQALDWNDSNG